MNFIDEEKKLERIATLPLVTHNYMFGTIDGIREQLTGYKGDPLPEVICKKHDLPLGTQGISIFYMITQPDHTPECASFSILPETFLLDIEEETND